MARTLPKKKSIAKLKAEAQKYVNAFIRRRDSVGGWFTCISCGKMLPVEQMNAGHYIHASRTSLLRFDEGNINGECVGCNCFNPSHLIGYRKNLIKKIGLAQVEKLDYNDFHRTPKKWTREELEAIIEKYKDG